MSTSIFQRIPVLNGNVELKRQEIRAYFHHTFDRYEQLFETLAGDTAYYQRPISLRHPLIFYFGHTATFFINKMILAGLISTRIEPNYESMFAIGVDEMSWDDLNEAHYNWPTVAQVKAYRDKVRATVDQVIQTAPLTMPIDWQNPWWTILMGIEHERIHLETSSVLIRQQRLELVKPHPAFEPCRHTTTAPQNSYVTIPAGTVRLGKERDDPYYGWDNEYGKQLVDIPEFETSRYLTSNQEFLEFVAADGYQIDSYWEEEGLAWRNYTQAQHPTFWLKQEQGWKLRLMLEEVDMPWDWPVEVNYHEAKAFCLWKKTTTGLPVRLPTEAEWYRLYDFAGLSEIPADKLAHANIHLDYYASSCPVNEFQHGDLYDVIGNVWQWTETPIHPFPGFIVHPFYDDFTIPTFDEQHNLFKGGSWVSCGNEALKAARYAFRRHFFQHAGFRYCVSNAPSVAVTSHYETDKLLSEYAEFHYGEEYFGVANFSKTLAELAIKVMADRPHAKALDLGCAAGRASFELARYFDQVTGIDFSARFIGLGVQLAQSGLLRYTLADEGDLVFYQERSLAELDLIAVKHKVKFIQGDACNLKPIYSGYDLILAANLIDRLYSPVKFVSTVHERLNIGGLLMITSPYTWLEEHTPHQEWLGGFKKDGENVSTLMGLKALLEPHFRLLQPPIQVPFVIRETSHKFQHSLAETTIWERML
jgi:5-histidylcysteine sulfoxide synthase/putative 4-mercaptohistidine N1-methyltranferase